MKHFQSTLAIVIALHSRYQTHQATDRRLDCRRSSLYGMLKKSPLIM